MSRRDVRGGARSLHCRGYDVRRVGERELRQAFSEFGRVIDVYLPKDYYTNQLRGFAYIQFEKDADADSARMKLDRSDVFQDNRTVNIMWAAGDRKTPHDMRRLDVERDNPHARQAREPSNGHRRGGGDWNGGNDRSRQGAGGRWGGRGGRRDFSPSGRGGDRRCDEYGGRKGSVSPPPGDLRKRQRDFSPDDNERRGGGDYNGRGRSRSRSPVRVRRRTSHGYDDRDVARDFDRDRESRDFDRSRDRDRAGTDKDRTDRDYDSRDRDYDGRDRDRDADRDTTIRRDIDDREPVDRAERDRETVPASANGSRDLEDKRDRDRHSGDYYGPKEEEDRHYERPMPERERAHSAA